jgi:hypothetical protein
MSNTADVLLETGTAYKSRVHAPLFFVESMLLIYLVICVVVLLFFCLRSVLCPNATCVSELPILDCAFGFL